jgi:hypothetical protein
MDAHPDRCDAGVCPVAFPRELTVETSTDGSAWIAARRGPTSVATVRASLKDPLDVPLSVPVGAVSARFTRLRQTARALNMSWCIWELSIHRPQ